MEEKIKNSDFENFLTFYVDQDFEESSKFLYYSCKYNKEEIS